MAGAKLRDNPVHDLAIGVMGMSEQAFEIGQQVYYVWGTEYRAGAIVGTRLHDGRLQYIVRRGEYRDEVPPVKLHTEPFGR